ncbi:hypothetical protein BS50DRAFT_162302 [Corynespora cassiicola Philippines]|uniref:Phosphoglycerate mutase-like protein n=1 Tax=Corynespora cassiicola Philippines TaxID=1448308 RepID=A0A2T2N6C8_CORCC|nr:hypothetical protein BS50DRAFT_162302 [Corynespora cassiicola Philippines]
MAKGPEVVVVARHGARLDASDKTWHLTSPTPYDPPLTYGGWAQGKALGLRIASLLHSRDNELADGLRNGPNADLAHLEFSTLDSSKTKRRRKIVIHTSPFLRCIQTSTAIAAGLSQYQPPATPNIKLSHPAKERNGVLGLADPKLEVFPKPHVGPDKILLRIDAFLGEWLSPDYFEDITPPPNSTMMVAGAKADLLRRGEYIEVQPTVHSSKGHFPGGWAKSSVSSAAPSRKNTDDGNFPTMGSLASVLPLRERSSSQGSAASLGSRASHKGASIATAHKVPSHIYDPPVPSYAVSPSDPIPRGYIAHARDACIDVDFQWDSMRAPQEWGDGGEYGDEWSTMHKRFRRGLAGMMTWYKEHGTTPPKDQYPGFTFREHVAPSSSKSPPTGSAESAVDDDDEELVLILVTHGAGCNALLGAITNQPVLLDVGLAALSMAVRRDVPRKPSVSSMHQRRASVVDAGMSDCYDMKLLASVDHLRPGVDPSKPPAPASPAVTASPSLEYRRRFTSTGGTNSPIDSPFSLGDPYRGLNSSLGSMRRSSTSKSSSRDMSNNISGSASPMTGLWSSLRAPTPDISSDGRRSPGADMVLNFREQQPKPAPTLNTNVPPAEETAPTTNGSSKTHEEKEQHDQVPPLPIGLGRTQSQSARGLWSPQTQAAANGLWGPPKMDDVYEHDRGPKRRWTVTERE